MSFSWADNQRYNDTLVATYPGRRLENESERELAS